ncbi:hypothetical protein P7H15_26070 [Paenibacillus larvae]|nr:hypothetical protein [Paenibacillus larvae]MDT2295590.1 hypothetical protein [Paenibacillus larvae]
MSLDVVAALGSVYNTGTRSYQNAFGLAVGGVKYLRDGTAFYIRPWIPDAARYAGILKIEPGGQLYEVSTVHTYDKPVCGPVKLVPVIRIRFVEIYPRP